MTSLREDFHSFFYGSLLGETLAARIKKEISQQSVNEHRLRDHREMFQFNEKQTMRFAASKYERAYRMVRKMNDPDQLTKNLYSITPICKGNIMQPDFILILMLFWLQLNYQEIRSKQVIGKSHGSNVKGLQTTAVYDEKKQTWTLNSPTVTSAKFWPGVLGHFSTHQVVQARAIVKGKSLGIQTFVVQIRNEKLKNHPNVEAFDLGPKLAFEGIDNGVLMFKGLEVPRTSMLMRYVKVTPDGQVQGLQNASAIKYSYGSMLNLRVQLVFGFMTTGILSPTAQLYYLYKAQGTQMRDDNRKYITDKLCLAFGVCLSNLSLLDLYKTFMRELANKNFDQADKLLAKAHITSATFKAISSRFTVDVSSDLLTHCDCSKFKVTKIPYSFMTYVPSATYEGDNTVLLQQTSNYLLFKMDLEKDFTGVKKTFRSSDWESGAAALQFIVTKRLIEIKKRMEGFQEKNVLFQKIWNEKEQVSLIKTSELWGYMTLLKLLSSVISKIPKHQEFYKKIGEGLSNFILQRTSDLQMEGFSIQFVETWKAFTEEQYRVMAEINAPIVLDYETLKFTARGEGSWMFAKL